ncbi:MAG: polyprenyl synthetase family protein [Thermodesulfobacteria bacterium]|nr:polyprenyl synthetase family protein [Thermodesulfobacteriota bacterium]
MLPPLSLIKAELETVENWLRKELQSQHPFINEVSHYIVFSGGKRIRPLLCVLCAKALNGVKDEVLYPTSILFEYLHAATLLHDDVVDQAEFRRGRKAARNLWGNQATILVGDYLYAKSLKLASRLRNPEIMEVITHTTLLMSEGEVLQLINLDNPALTEKEYKDVIYRKTAVLISACCEVGALLAEADLETCKALKNFGTSIGMAFQIVDDLLDYLSTETGKDLGKDFKEGKITLPVIYALEEAKENDRKRLLELFKIKNPDESHFMEAKDLIDKYKGFEKTKKKAEEYIFSAKKDLNCLKDSPYKSALNFITDYILERNK